LDDKEFHIQKIQEELEHRQSRFESQCESRTSELADRERQLNEKEVPLLKLQLQMEEREKQLNKRTGESEDEEEPPPKKRKLGQQKKISLMARCIIVTIM